MIRDFGVLEMLVRIGYAYHVDGMPGLWLTEKGREYVRSLGGASC